MNFNQPKSSDSLWNKFDSQNQQIENLSYYVSKEKSSFGPRGGARYARVVHGTVRRRDAIKW